MALRSQIAKSFSILSYKTALCKWTLCENISHVRDICQCEVEKEGGIGDIRCASGSCTLGIVLLVVRMRLLLVLWPTWRRYSTVLMEEDIPASHAV